MDQKKTGEGLVTIYALECPLTHRIRYVGSSREPKRRYWRHMGSAFSSERSPLRDWLRELRLQGQRPVMLFLEELPEQYRSPAERLWTSALNLRGESLFNRDNIYRNHTPAQLRHCRLTGKPRWHPTVRRKARSLRPLDDERQVSELTVGIALGAAFDAQ